MTETPQNLPENLEELAEVMLKRKLASTKMDALRLAQSMIDQRKARSETQKKAVYTKQFVPHIPPKAEELQKAQQTTQQQVNTDQFHSLIHTLQAQIQQQAQVMEHMKNEIQQLHQKHAHVQSTLDTHAQTLSVHHDWMKKQKEEQMQQPVHVPDQDQAKEMVEHPFVAQEEYTQEEAQPDFQQDIKEEITEVETPTSKDIELRVEEQEQIAHKEENPQPIIFTSQPEEQTQQPAQHQQQQNGASEEEKQQKPESKVDLSQMFKFGG